MDFLTMLKEFQDTVLETFGKIKASFTKMNKRIEPLETFTKDYEPFDNSDNEKRFEAVVKGLESIEPFDDTEIMEKIVDITKSIPEGYDDSELKSQISEIEPYDDRALRELIKGIKPFDNSGNEEEFEKLLDIVKAIPAQHLNIKAVEKAIEAIIPFDNSDNEKMFTEIKENITAPYNDTEISQRIDDIKIYDDTAIVEKLIAVEKAIPIIPEFKEYDDTAIIKKLTEVEEAIPIIPESKEYDDTAIIKKIEAIKEYDDTGLQKQINAMQELQKKEIAEIKEKAATTIQVQTSTTKHYTGDPEEKGTMILHENNLYVNMLDDNDSVPSDMNKSYKLLIKAPKELDHKGVYVAGEKYVHGDMVMKDNATWFKTSELAQEIPSVGWKLMAKAVRGKKGDAGDVSIVEGYEDAIQSLYDEISILKEGMKGLLNGTD